MAGKDLLIPVFGSVYRISSKHIRDSEGKLPGFDVCVIISRYLLLCPDKTPGDKAWSSFRDMKDSGPLTKYFKNEVEEAIAARFTGKVDQLKAACLSLGGHHPGIDISYDCYLQCDALPRIPLLLLFNDAEDGFPATSSVLFERRAQDYLDPECLAMTGRLFYSLLKNAQNRRCLS